MSNYDETQYSLTGQYVPREAMSDKPDQELIELVKNEIKAQLKHAGECNIDRTAFCTAQFVIHHIRQYDKARLVESVGNKPDPLGYGTYELNAYRRAMKDFIKTTEQVMGTETYQPPRNSREWCEEHGEKYNELNEIENFPKEDT